MSSTVITLTDIIKEAFVDEPGLDIYRGDGYSVIYIQKRWVLSIQDDGFMWRHGKCFAYVNPATPNFFNRLLELIHGENKV